MGTTTHFDSEVTVALQGTLDTFALPDVLRLLAATKKTGCLRLSASRGPGQIWIDNGAVAGIKSTSAAADASPVEGLFELLRSTEGSFTFDADVVADDPTDPTDVEILLADADLLLAEWRDIEAIVPSLDALVRLRRTLDAKSVTIPKAQWPALVAVGGGATVGEVGAALGLAEIPVSRAVRDLVVLGVAEIVVDEPPALPDDDEVDDDVPEAAPEADLAPAGHEAPAPALPEPLAPLAPVIDLAAPAPVGLPALDLGPDPAEPARDGWADAPVSSYDEVTTEPTPPAADAPSDEGLPVARPLRARRAKPLAAAEDATPERFVPLDLPGHAPSPATVLASRSSELDEDAPAQADGAEADDLAAAFPGLANRSSTPSEEDEELSRQLATLSPRAAEAVRAAAAAETDEEREAALDAADTGDERINRGMLLKFLSSVKS